jgi:hypothetical protein
MGLLGYLRASEATLDRIKIKLEATVATAKDFTDLLKVMDDETTRIAGKFEDLLAQLETGGLSAEEEAAVYASFHAEVDRMKEIGKDATQPIPPTV